MIETFEKLEPEKKRRVLNAALEEFSDKGYKQTATDDIVSRADISKGALFHYFGSKQKLYVYLIEFVLDTYLRDIYPKIDLAEPDLFKRLRQATRAKLEVSVIYPALATFWERAKGDIAKVGNPQIQEKVKKAAKLAEDFLADIDPCGFKEGLEFSRMIKVMLWTFDSFSKEVIKSSKTSEEAPDWEKIYAEADEYLNFFQKLFYKEVK